MSMIRSSGTGPEKAMDGLLRGMGVDFTLNDAELPGKPDFVIHTSRLALFVDSCFFHGCPTHYSKPKSNVAFWGNKVSGNMRRDSRVDRALRRGGWRVTRVWEHSLRKQAQNRLAGRLGRRIAALRVSQARNEPGFDRERH